MTQNTAIFVERLNQILDEHSDRFRIGRGRTADFSEVFVRKYSSVYRVLRGDLKPDFDLLLALSSYFRVSVDWLLGISNIKCQTDLTIIDDFKKLQIEHAALSMCHDENLLILKKIRHLLDCNS